MSTSVTMTVEQDGIELQIVLTPESYDGHPPTIEELIEHAAKSCLVALADFDLFGPDAPPLDIDTLDGGERWIKNPEPVAEEPIDTDEFFAEPVEGCQTCRGEIRYIGATDGWIHDPRLEEYFHLAVGPLS